MPMYNLIEYKDNYSKPAGNLWKYYRDKTALTDPGAIANFHITNNNSVKVKQKITGQTNDDRKKNYGAIKISK